MDFHDHPGAPPRSWEPSLKTLDWLSSKLNYNDSRIPETDSRGPETDPESLETELRVHRTQGTLENRLTDFASQLGGL